MAHKPCISCWLCFSQGRGVSACSCFSQRSQNSQQVCWRVQRVAIAGRTRESGKSSLPGKKKGQRTPLSFSMATLYSYRGASRGTSVKGLLFCPPGIWYRTAAKINCTSINAVICYRFLTGTWERPGQHKFPGWNSVWIHLVVLTTNQRHSGRNCGGRINRVHA